MLAWLGLINNFQMVAYLKIVPQNGQFTQIYSSACLATLHPVAVAPSAVKFRLAEHMEAGGSTSKFTQTCNHGTMLYHVWTLLGHVSFAMHWH